LFNFLLGIDNGRSSAKGGPCAKKAATTSEDSLADAISDKSMLGRPAPEVQAEKWLGDKPASQGQIRLITSGRPGASRVKGYPSVHCPAEEVLLTGECRWADFRFPGGS